MQLAEFTSKYRAKLIIESYKKWIKSGNKVLDVGCGNGIVSVQIANALEADVTGCDILDYLTRNIKFVQMNNDHKLPFGNKKFDIVMFNDVLHHMNGDTQEELLKEALRVGKCAVIFELIPTPTGKLFDWMLNKIHNKRMNIPFTFRSPEKWKLLFTKKKNVKIMYEFVKSPLIYPFKHIAFKLSAK